MLRNAIYFLMNLLKKKKKLVELNTLVKAITKWTKQNGQDWERAQLPLQFPFAGFISNVTIASHSVLLSITFVFMRK